MVPSLAVRHGLAAVFAAAVCLWPASPALCRPPKTSWLPSLQAEGLDVRAMDATADPCSELYRFACGSWRPLSPVPVGDSGTFAAYDAAHARFRAEVRELLAQDAGQASTRQALQAAAQFHSGCEAALAETARGAALPDFAAPADMEGLAAWVGRVQGFGIHPFFRWVVDPDLRNGKRTALWIDEPPLGLGNRDAYLATGPAAVQLRHAYAAHVRDVLAHFGVASATEAAQAVIAIETRLAKSSKAPEERRNASGMFNPMGVEQLQGTVTSLPWSTWQRAFGTPGTEEWIITSPRIVQEINVLWQSAPLVDLVAYVQWAIARDVLPFAGPAAVRLADRWQRTLAGKQAPDAQGRCLDLTLLVHGHAVFSEWLKRKGGQHWQRDLSETWLAIRLALVEQSASAGWLDPPTRATAGAKLADVALAPLPPSAWSAGKSAGLVESVLAARRQQNAWELAQVGKAPQLGRALSTAAEAGTYFDPQRNAIFVSPVIFQPPLWPKTASVGLRFGGLGALLGHEAVHAIDREGGFFDADGTLRSWWTPASAVGLASAVTCLSEQLASDARRTGLRVSPNALVSELAADIAGLRAAHTAMRRALPHNVDALQADRTFFVAYAQAWCAVLPAETERDMLARGPHPPPRLRVDAAARNHPAFVAAFGCKAGTPMAPKSTCTIW